MAKDKWIEDGESWQSPYQEQIDGLLGKLSQRKTFSYEYADDPLYQAYADAYRREGRRATEDAIGLAAQNTGGKASSYAVTAAQQAGSYYSAKQADKIPELYKLAYEVWRDGYQDDLDLLDRLGSLDKSAYQRYRDEAEDRMRAEELEYERAMEALERERKDEQTSYDRERDALADARYESEQAYQRERDAVKDSQFDRQQALREQSAAAKSGGKSAKSAKSTSSGAGDTVRSADAPAESAGVRVYGVAGTFTESEAEAMVTSGLAEKVKSGGRTIYKVRALG